MVSQSYSAYNQIFNPIGVERFDKRAPIFRNWHRSPCEQACGVGTEVRDAPLARGACNTLASPLQLPGAFGTWQRPDPFRSFYLFSYSDATSPDGYDFSPMPKKVFLGFRLSPDLGVSRVTQDKIINTSRY